MSPEEAMAERSIGWLVPEREGIYIRPADCWVDPARAVGHALVTHGHSDHARGGHGRVTATPETLAIMATRYGVTEGAGRPAELRVPVDIGGGVTATFFPAGHVLGSAQILLERDGERVVVTGDFKRRPDPTCTPFEPVKCDVLVTEATFGLPVFRHPPIEREIAKLTTARADNPDRCILVGAYSLGKAQRVIAECRLSGYTDPIYLHGAMERMCALYQDFGIDLGDLQSVAGTSPDKLKGAVIIAPPSALQDRWSRRLPDPIACVASGWMRVRQRARQQGVELPLIISDHADWDELTATITEIDPSEIWVTHGREDALIRWCELNQRSARALSLVGYEDEDES
jgi:putative mRNA 3-end processing factor